MGISVFALAQTHTKYTQNTHTGGTNLPCRLVLDRGSGAVKRDHVPRKQRKVVTIGISANSAVPIDADLFGQKHQLLATLAGPFERLQHVEQQHVLAQHHAEVFLVDEFAQLEGASDANFGHCARQPDRVVPIRVAICDALLLELVDVGPNHAVLHRRQLALVRRVPVVVVVVASGSAGARRLSGEPKSQRLGMPSVS